MTTNASRILGDYVLRRRVARGGMGDVWLAHRSRASETHRWVAVKTMHAHLATQAALVSQFLREARVGSWLQHPNAVGVLDAGTHEGVPFLVMEWVDGIDLRRLTARARAMHVALSPVLAGYVVHQVLCALEAASSLRDPMGRAVPVVHRDVSPENILVGRHGEVRLADFGLVDHVEAPLPAGPSTTRGKLAYMSPEHLAGLPLDARSDLYSMGILFHELLCGSRPYDADAVLDAMEHARSPQHHASEVAPGLPLGLAELSWRWRQPWPDERAPSITHARAELERHLAPLISGIPSAALRDLVLDVAGGSPRADQPPRPVARARPCAKCGGTLAPAALLGGLLMDQCPDCHGVFLEKAEQVRLLGGTEWMDITEDVFAPAPPRPGLDAVRGECPVCRVTMTAHQARARHVFTLERCATCQGLWFDAGELEAMAHGDLADVLLALQKRVGPR